MEKEEKLIERISDFIEHHRTQVKIISEIKTEDFDRKYKKLLFSSQIDALSRIVYPRKNSRERFIEFVKNFGEWGEGNQVSLNHLIRLLAKCPDPEFQELRKLANEKIKEWKQGELIGLDRDLDFKHALSKWPKDKCFNKLFNEIDLSNLQHYNLLYVYRNSLVHEFVSPGSEFEWEHNTFPFYIYIQKINSEFSSENTWELNYPVKFYIRVILSCITNLEKYLKENQLDPYAYLNSGDYWIDILN